MAKFELDEKGSPSEPKVSKPSGFELDQKGHGVPPSYPGYGGDNGSHVRNYPEGNAFVAAVPPAGFNSPSFSAPLVDSSGGIKMKNDQKGGDDTAMPSFGEFDGAEHRVFGHDGSKASLSTNGQGRGVENRDESVQMFGSNEGQRDMNPPMPEKAGGAALKGYS